MSGQHHIPAPRRADNVAGWCLPSQTPFYDVVEAAFISLAQTRDASMIAKAICQLMLKLGPANRVRLEERLARGLTAQQRLFEDRAP